MEPPPGMIRTGPGSFVRPEMVFAWAERMREVSREICRVETGQGMATGFLISPNLVMTAAQVLPESQKDSAGARPDAMRFRFDYQYERDGVTLRQPSIYSLAEDWLVDYERGSEDGYHFALLRLDGTPGSDLAPGQDKRRGWLQAAPADQLHAGDPVLTLGHYQAEPLRMECLYAETLPGGKGNLLVLTSASGIRGPGASGGPCCDSLWRVVGLRFASSFPTGVTPGSGDNAVLRVQCSGIHAILARPKVAAALEASLKGAGSAS